MIVIPPAVELEEYFLKLAKATWTKYMYSDPDGEDELKKKVDDLQKEVNDYVRNDAGKVQNALENNTQALKDLREIIIMSKSSRKRINKDYYYSGF